MQVLMNALTRPALALLLGAALTASLTACDYRYSPGKNTQFHNEFSNAPGWRKEDVWRDSINYKQRVTKPTGLGSAAAIKAGTVDEQLESAPSGNSPQNPNGTPAPMPEERPTETGI
jgi:hypothetical protein